jgi:YidC/Oxa1 family membrane protein insertase
MHADAMTGQYAQQQKMLLYILPLVFAVGGIAFPIGVLFYWTTSNLWTMCQQFYVIRNNPAPGTPAAKAKQDRDAAKRARHGLPDPAVTLDPGTQSGATGATGATSASAAAPVAAKRPQPKNQPRSQRKKPAKAAPSGKATGKPTQRSGPDDGPGTGQRRPA